MLQNLIKDRDAHTIDETKLNKTVELLTQADIFPLLDVSSLATHSSTTKFKAKIKEFGVEHEVKSENIVMNISMATNFIKDIIASFRECHSHV